ncbi:hypothetical protein LIER_38318 [Lithospermum erythrorhizon]|uniref:DUF7903 domain-containing protein n=1 Tax=Lithospermum erythrorhizon TaxID=34254 RepID=A0AAV3Q057_LITER
MDEASMNLYLLGDTWTVHSTALIFFHISSQDNEIENISLLIGYAILDPEVKGGLRWPLGKDSSGDRYNVRPADRFDFRSSKGENSGEVTLKMLGIVSLLQEPTLQPELVSQMLKDNLRLMWEYCLNKTASASMLA